MRPTLEYNSNKGPPSEEANEDEEAFSSRKTILDNDKGHEDTLLFPHLFCESRHRKICSECNRPQSSCLCASLPSSPLRTSTLVLILQHPHESKKKLATVPILQKCLSNCLVIKRRKFIAHDMELLRRLVPGESIPDERRSLDQYCPILLLFPSKDAQSLQEIVSERDKSSFSAGVNLDCYGCLKRTVDKEISHEIVKTVLIVLDGTWQQAKEMLRASKQILDGIALPVCLPYDPEKEGPPPGNESLLLRKEPCLGCVSTMEAVARALGILERNGLEVEQCLLKVLERVVMSQQRPTWNTDDATVPIIKNSN